MESASAACSRQLEKNFLKFPAVRWTLKLTFTVWSFVVPLAGLQALQQWFASQDVPRIAVVRDG